MPIKSILMPSIPCASRDYLESATAIYQVRGLITRNQANSIVMACGHDLPATVELSQRTPKGVVYITLNGKAHSEVTTRAHIHRLYPELG
jgi:hypothetical protein